MKVGVPKETLPGERRVALVPDVLPKLKAAGIDVLVERGAGTAASYTDAMYGEAGATLVVSGGFQSLGDKVRDESDGADQSLPISRRPLP